jgi:hypothetical protein
MCRKWQKRMDQSMSPIRLDGVGYCARISQVGDWAFDFALDLAQRNNARFNIFVFPTSSPDIQPQHGYWPESKAQLDEEDFAFEREIRLRYENRLGNYLKIGFRLCVGEMVSELQRYLARREHAVLVLAYESGYGPSGELPVDQLVQRLQGPVVLVGPERRDEIHLNWPASLIPEQLGLTKGMWVPIITENVAKSSHGFAGGHTHSQTRSSLAAHTRERKISGATRSAIPLRVVYDKDGDCWLCPSDVDASGDLLAQGCWRCKDIMSKGNRQKKWES